MTSRPARWLAGVSLALLAAALLQWATPGPPPLAYDPETWLIWGRELARGELDVTVGPAIKPLPMAFNAATIGALGSDALARSLWSAVVLAGFVVACGLAWQIGRDAGRPPAWGLLAVAVAVVTPTLLAGALTGAAEPLALAGLLAAAVQLARQRPWRAVPLLAGVALLRPEAIPILVLLLGALLRRHREPGRRWRVVVAGGLLVGGVLGAWVGLQRLGGGALSGGVDAATALRPGQPGLSEVAVLATLAEAATMLLPAGALAAGVLVAARRPSAGAAAGTHSTVVRSLLGIGGVWIATVAAMSELGFSGEARYLAPGTAAVSVGLVAWAGQRIAARASRRSRAVTALVGAAFLLAAAATTHAEWRDARALAGRQAQLDALLRQPAVQRSVRACARIAVPQFLRPPTAWRLRLAMAQIQSPAPAGADCRLVARGATPLPAGWGWAGSAGAWEWWVLERR